MGSESTCLQVFSSLGAAAGTDWLPRAPDAWGPPTHDWTPPPRAAICFSVCLPVSRSVSPLQRCPAPRRLRPFPLPLPGAPNLSWSLPGRQADTRQIGIQGRKGRKATLQPGNKGAMKAPPVWRAKDASARTSESELAITPS